MKGRPYTPAPGTIDVPPASRLVPATGPQLPTLDPRPLAPLQVVPTVTRTDQLTLLDPGPRLKLAVALQGPPTPDQLPLLAGWPDPLLPGVAQRPLLTPRIRDAPLARTQVAPRPADHQGGRYPFLLPLITMSRVSR